MHGTIIPAWRRNSHVAQLRYPRFQYEIWRPECTVERTYVWVDANRFTHRVFPSRYLRFNLEFSPALLGAVQALRRSNDLAMVWMHGLYNVHACLLAPTLSKFNSVGQSHGGYPAPIMFSMNKHAGRLAYLPLAPLEKLTMPLYPAILAISQEEVGHIKAFSPKSRTLFSPAGVDFQEFTPGDVGAARQVCGVDPNSKVVLYVGRLAPEKGIEFLVEAFAWLRRSCDQARLYIIGLGPLAAQLKEKADRLGLQDSVRFLGFLGGSQLVNWYRAADVTVMPSLHEWFGMVAAESLACGTPVVATDAGGARDIVREFECGVLVPPRDAMSLAEGIQAVLSGRDGRRPSIEKGRNAFDWSVKMSKTHAIFGIDPHNDA